MSARSSLWTPACLLVTALIAPTTQEGPLEAVAFMAGCWEGTFGGGRGTIEEHYTSPSSNLMLGTTRYLRDGVTVSYEFTEIVADADGVRLIPHPSGQASVPFQLTRSASNLAVFENPEHDFPQMITYELSEGVLTAQIENPGGDPRRWSMRPAPCN
jgi:hypothetical protein